MPYSRRRYSRRRNIPYRRKPGSAESKRLTTYVANADIDNLTGRVTLLNGLDQDTSISGRQGRSVKMVSLALRGKVVKPGANLAASSAVRYAIVLDSQPTGTLPVLNDYWQITVGSVPVMIANRNVDNMRRFKTIATWTVVIHGDANEGTAVAVTLVPWEKFVRIPYEIWFDGQDASIGSVKKNALYFFEASDTLVANVEPVSGFVATLRFRDP